jgi:hypothetical protein
LIRARLHAHGAEPSRAKDLAGQAGGWGMLLFARLQPDPPGKLAAEVSTEESAAGERFASTWERTMRAQMSKAAGR